MWRKILMVLVVLCLAAVAFVLSKGDAPAKGGAGEIHVSCGAGLLKPVEEISRQFEEEQGVKVRLHFGGFGVLMGNLAMGQPCDVFMPGAAKYVEDALAKGLVAPGTRLDLALHVPAIAVPEGNPAGIACLEDLAKPGVRVGLGDAKACAIGQTADLILKRNGLADRVEPNVRLRTMTADQLLLYVTMKQVDAAILWEDLTQWPAVKGKVRAVAIQPEKNIISTISAVRAAKSSRPEAADHFIAFLRSERAQAVWREWGFRPCGE